MYAGTTSLVIISLADKEWEYMFFFVDTVYVYNQKNSEGRDSQSTFFAESEILSLNLRLFEFSLV